MIDEKEFEELRILTPPHNRQEPVCIHLEIALGCEQCDLLREELDNE